MSENVINFPPVRTGNNSSTSGILFLNGNVISLEEVRAYSIRHLMRTLTFKEEEIGCDKSGVLEFISKLSFFTFLLSSKVVRELEIVEIVEGYYRGKPLKKTKAIDGCLEEVEEKSLVVSASCKHSKKKFKTLYSRLQKLSKYHKYVHIKQGNSSNGNWHIDIEIRPPGGGVLLIFLEVLKI